VARSVFETPLGKIVAVADEIGICSLDFDENASASDEENAHLTQLQSELREYFSGQRKTFDVRLNPGGTPFQMAVWRTLCDIPYGNVISYSQEAQMLSHAKAVRAVANANGKNPLPIIIPCHRVIAKNGGIGGYSGGIWRKEFMLELERKNR
jgi:methylated-DNA-[protein]-cysteine S-methyltransferase